jgi:hypothetical protein
LKTRCSMARPFAWTAPSAWPRAERSAPPN